MGEMKTWYDVKNSRLKFFYGTMEEEDCAEFSGFVPKSVVVKGDEAVKEYAALQIKNYKQEEKSRLRERWQKICATNYPIEVSCGNVVLKGRIVDYQGPKSDRGAITVLLEEPKEYRGKIHHAMCFAYGMASRQFFEEDGKLTGWAVEKAKSSIVEIYKEKRKEIEKKQSNPAAYETMKRLNKKEKNQ